MATSGEIPWPSPGRTQWPLTEHPPGCIKRPERHCRLSGSTGSTKEGSLIERERLGFVVLAPAPRYGASTADARAPEAHRRLSSGTDCSRDLMLYQVCSGSAFKLEE